jgi:hypothetical protein
MPNFNAKKTEGIRPFDKMIRNLPFQWSTAAPAQRSYAWLFNTHISGEHCRAFALTPPTADGKKTKLYRGGIP